MVVCDGLLEPREVADNVDRCMTGFRAQRKWVVKVALVGLWLVEIARGLDKQTIAEYVDDAETLDLVRTMGVDHAQGFHLAKPAPLELLGARRGRDAEPRGRDAEPRSRVRRRTSRATGRRGSRGTFARENACSAPRESRGRRASRHRSLPRRALDARARGRENGRMRSDRVGQRALSARPLTAALALSVSLALAAQAAGDRVTVRDRAGDRGAQPAIDVRSAVATHGSHGRLRHVVKVADADRRTLRGTEILIRARGRRFSVTAADGVTQITRTGVRSAGRVRAVRRGNRMILSFGRRAIGNPRVYRWRANVSVRGFGNFDSAPNRGTARHRLR
ncbi:MAG: EAL domain-containing protein [Thermoleophilaceae bacterium]